MTRATNVFYIALPFTVFFYKLSYNPVLSISARWVNVIKEKKEPIKIIKYKINSSVFLASFVLLFKGGVKSLEGNTFILKTQNPKDTFANYRKIKNGRRSIKFGRDH